MPMKSSVVSKINPIVTKIILLELSSPAKVFLRLLVLVS